MATLREASNVTDKKIKWLKSQVASDVKSITNLASLVNDPYSNCLCITLKYGELQKRLSKLKIKASKIVAPGCQLQADVNSVTEERNALAAKCKELALEAQCIPGLEEETKILHARVTELEERCEEKAPKVRAKRRVANTEVVTEKIRTERAEHTAQIAHCESDDHELMGKLKVLERRISVADLR